MTPDIQDCTKWWTFLGERKNMSPIEILLVAVALAMDVFAVSLGIGANRSATSPRSTFRLTFHFSLFQGLMTLVGWLLGSSIIGLILSFNHWVAFGLLCFVGAHMIKESLSSDETSARSDPSRGHMLVMLSVATSLDALAVGLSMAMLNVNIFWTCLVIALVTLVFAISGLNFGSRLGKRFGKSMEIAGGLLLIGIGIHTLL
jgi:manganese efflux pump family protein